jgi:hypothetical protein
MVVSQISTATLIIKYLREAVTRKSQKEITSVIEKD